MIIKEAIGTGRTISEAQENAREQLSVGIDEEVQFEIISEYKKKVLGLFGGSDARVRAYVELPDHAIKKEKTAKPDNRNKKNDRRENVKKEQKPAVEKNVKTEVKADEVKVEEPKAEVKGVPASEVDPQSKAGRAYKYLSEVLVKLGCDNFTATICEVEGGSKIVLEGSEALGMIIGRRGETLDALQYLASLVANENGSGYYRVVIDIGNYREKRESTLEGLAKRTAGQVLRTGRSRSLEPMNPYERRIIHTAIQNIEGVTSTSIGDGANRRVVIVPEGKQLRLPQDRRGDRRNGGRPNRAVKPAAEATAPAKPKETDGTKLYGKLK